MRTNNYVVPNIIKIANKLDIIFGCIAYSLVALMFADATREELLGTPYHLATGIFLLIEVFVAICKVGAYIACIARGYKVSILGFIMYIGYIIASILLAILYLGTWIYIKA